MTENEITKHDHVLMGLVISLQAGAMQQMGKIADPHTGEVVRDLDSARATIDILEMLKEKCRHGTPEVIVRMLDTAVMELQMNYLDEKKKDVPREEPQQQEAAADPAAAKAEAAGPDAAAADPDAADPEPDFEPEEG